MKSAEARKLQGLINRTARAASAFNQANKKLCEFCIGKYGVEPADVDCDSIIDTVQGGAGESAGVPAADFDDAMREAMRMCGVSMPAAAPVAPDKGAQS